MVLKIKLHSDFTDYYDSWFDGDGYTWRRTSDMLLGRPAMMQQLLDWGFAVPTFGTAKTVIPKAIEAYQTDNLYFIVHSDIYDHSGEGKILMDAPACLSKHRNEFVTHFLGDVNAGRFYSYKFMRVGSKAFGLKTSGNYWKAEYSDDVEHRFSCESVSPSYNDKIPHALYTIDYIFYSGRTYAVGFNSAPHIGLLWEKLSGKQVADKIREAIEYFRAKSLNYCDALQAGS